MLINNRREAIRMGTLIPCGLKPSNSGHLDRWGTLVDFSLTGGQLRTYFSFNPRQKTLLTFSVKDKFLFRDMDGEVVWVDKENGYNFVGIQFSPQDRNRILEAMRFMINSN